MPRRARNSSSTTVGATALGLLTIGALVTYDLVRSRPTPRAATGPVSRPVGVGPAGPPAPVAVPTEPAEGYQSRWASRRAHAIRRCKMDPAVVTWPAALACALAFVFPEAGDWEDSVAWPAWMHDASALAQQDLAASVAAMFPGTIPNGWQAQLWLRGARESLRCQGAPNAAVCIANAIYPVIGFPPSSTAPTWIGQFWLAVRDLVAARQRA